MHLNIVAPEQRPPSCARPERGARPRPARQPRRGARRRRDRRRDRPRAARAARRHPRRRRGRAGRPPGRQGARAAGLRGRRGPHERAARATARSSASASSRSTATRARATARAYVAAAPPEHAEPLYERFCDRLGAARGVFGAMMEVELVNDGPVTLLLEACGRLPPPAMPPDDRFVPRFAAEPPQDLLPYGRWAATLREEFLAACLRIDAEGEDLGEPGELVWYPDRTWDGRTYVPATARTTTGFELFGYVSFAPDPDGGEPRRLRTRAPTSRAETAEEQPRLAARPLRRGRRRLARRAGQGRAAMTLVWGIPLVPRRRDRDRRARRPRRRPVRAARGPLHAARARRLPRRLPRRQALERARRGAGGRVALRRRRGRRRRGQRQRQVLLRARRAAAARDLAVTS